MPVEPIILHEPRRIALVKPSALGDIVHSLPVLSAIRRRWPAAHITWIVNRAYESLLTGHPHLDALMPFDRGALRRGLRTGSLTVLRFARQLRAARFDLVIDLQGLMRTGLMSLATRAERRIGFANAREGAAKCYTDRVDVPDSDSIHAVDRYWRVVEAIGAADHTKEFLVPISDSARARARELLAPLPRPWLILGVGARWSTKRWPARNFAEAAREAIAQFGGAAVFIGGREDAPLARSAQLHLNCPNLDLCGRTSLPLLAAILELGDIVVANDTGPLHLAAALGRPTIAPYTCTLIARHGPYGQANRAVAADISCHGSYLKSCDHMSCLPTIPPARLRPIIFEVLSSWRRRQTA